MTGAHRQAHPVGIVIPTIDREPALKATVDRVFDGAGLNHCAPPRIAIAVAPSGSNDDARSSSSLGIDEASDGQVIKIVRSKTASRGAQLNDGVHALLSVGPEAPSILLLLHADTLLPYGWDRAIVDAVAQNEACQDGVSYLGCFRLDLNLPSSSKLSIPLQIMLWTANARARWAHLPYGDQAYFLRTSLLQSVDWLTPLPIMEDVDLLYKLRKHGRRRRLAAKRPLRRTLPSNCTSRLVAMMRATYNDYCAPSLRVQVLDKAVKTSPRRWLQNGVWWNTALNQFYMAAWHLGVSPEVIYGWYYGQRRAKQR